MALFRSIKSLLALGLQALNIAFKAFTAFFIPVEKGSTTAEPDHTLIDSQAAHAGTASQAVAHADHGTVAPMPKNTVGVTEPTAAKEIEKVFGQFSEYDSDGELVAVTSVDVTNFYYRDWASIAKKPKATKRLSRVGSEVPADEGLERVE